MHKTLCDDGEGGLKKEDCIHTPLLCAKTRIIYNFGSQETIQKLIDYWIKNHSNDKDREEYLRLVDESYREVVRQMQRDAREQEEGEEKEEGGGGSEN